MNQLQDESFRLPSAKSLQNKRPLLSVTGKKKAGTASFMVLVYGKPAQSMHE